MAIIKITGFQCEKCGHKWAAKKQQRPGEELKLPTVCPHCHSRRWNGKKSPWYDYLSFVFEKDKLPVEIFIKSHIKAGHDHAQIYDCVMDLSKEKNVNNAKAWLEELWQKRK